MSVRTSIIGSPTFKNTSIGRVIGRSGRGGGKPARGGVGSRAAAAPGVGVGSTRSREEFKLRGWESRKREANQTIYEVASNSSLFPRCHAMLKARPSIPETHIASNMRAKVSRLN